MERRKQTKEFSHRNFIYDRSENRYVCPCHVPLSYQRDYTTLTGKKYHVYANYPACWKCPRKAECTKSKHREIRRLRCQDVLDVVAERTKRNKALYRKRQEIVEHVFGTIKAVWGYRQFLCRGKEKVGAEAALSCFAYNLRRVCTIYRKKGLNPVAV